VQEVEFSLDCVSPSAQILLEVASISILEGMLELVERLIFSVQESPVAGEEVVVYHFGKRHLIPPGCTLQCTEPTAGRLV
jgi:hypothetical protein